MESLRITGKWVLALIVIIGICFCAAEAETVVSSQLPFDPPDTWEEAKASDLTIVDIYGEEHQGTWYWIRYEMENGKAVTVFYRASNGSFSWAEVSADEYMDLPESPYSVWGEFRYDLKGKIDDIYFCQEFESGAALYCFYNGRMEMKNTIEYYYAETGPEDRIYYSYDRSSGEWKDADNKVVELLPFDGDEVLASIYNPDVRIAVADPSPLTVGSFDVVRVQENAHNDHDVWLKLDCSGGENLVSFHYQIFVREEDGSWRMTWEEDSGRNETSWWIGEDGEHFFKAQVTDGVTEVEVQTGTFTVSGDPITNILVLPEDATVVETDAFANDIKIQGVIMPAGIKRIESRAFAGCAGLRKVYIPSGINYIAEDAFSGIGYMIIITDRIEGAVNQFAAAKGWPCIQGNGID